MSQKNKRPVFLDLTRIHFPVMAVMSGLHRISGVILFLAIPFVIYLFQLSLSGVYGFTQVVDILDYFFVKLLFVFLIASFAHHFFAGIRYLFIDIDVGVNKSQGRFTAKMVIFGTIVVLFFAVFFF